MIETVKRIQVLSSQECENALLQVLLLKSWWIKRHQQVPFYTLGLAAYLDDQYGSSYQRAYTSPELVKYNQLLLRYFLSVYQKVITHLAELFDAPAFLNEQNLALPGFHIYEAHTAFAKPVAKVHRDLQFCHLFAERESLAPSRVFSFTLPIALPEVSGLNFYNNDGELDGFEPYHTGEMVVHSGLKPHQAVLNSVAWCEPRITLQGHGLRRDDSWIVYW
jgi:hypothetical protein